jgi:hypothetical protein
MMNTREEWLAEAVRRLDAGVFQNPALMGKQLAKMPEKWQVTCGWCKGMSSNSIACCVYPECSKNQTTHLFVIPTQDDPFSVMGSLTHEMVHAIVGKTHAHGGDFLKMVRVIGLVGKPTQCTAIRGTALGDVCEAIIKDIGVYPHAAMVPFRKPTKPSPWVRWKSKNWPEFTVLANTKKVAKYGLPRDPKGDEMMPVDPDKVFGIKQDPRQPKLPHVDEGEDDE